MSRRRGRRRAWQAGARPAGHGLPHGQAKLVGWLALFWNLVGAVMFLMQAGMGPEQLALLPAEQRLVAEALPASLRGAHALWVFAGVVGALGLLLVRRWAITAFALSLLGAVVQTSGVYIHTPAWALSGLAGIPLALGLVAVAVALLWYARRAAARGLLL